MSLPPPPPVLAWKKFEERGEPVAHVICHHLTNGFVQGLHSHDFAEVYWCVEGECAHLINGCELRFAPGDLVMIRPEDLHEIRGVTAEECIYYLVSFPEAVYNHMRHAYAESVDDFWGGRAQMAPCLRLNAVQQAWFNGIFLELLAHPQDRLLLDRFLVNLTYELREATRSPFAHCPSWLRDALEELRDPAWSSLGSPALEELTGRSREHIARVLKQHSGYTPSMAVNRFRVEAAAVRLVLTQDSILTIALGAGYTGLGHFYAQFRKIFHCPPNIYRTRYSRLLSPASTK